MGAQVCPAHDLTVGRLGTVIRSRWNFLSAVKIMNAEFSGAEPEPEIGKSIVASGIRTNYHDVGVGFPLVFIHGSGPGVSAWANWRLVLPQMAKHARVLALDMVGFGFSERSAGQKYNLDVWVEQLLGFLDALNLEQADLVGNSFGGALGIAMAVRYPNRVRRLALMGSPAPGVTLSPGLDSVWGYTPSIENMGRLLDLFAHDRRFVSDDLAELRYKASIRPGFHESYSSMFPAPRERWLRALASKEEDVRNIPHQTMIIHGREDRVVPLENGLRLANWIPRAQLHVFGQCGHWAQIEHAARFSELLRAFVAEAEHNEPSAL